MKVLDIFIKIGYKKYVSRITVVFQGAMPL
jgi:hypothetical protein